ncbi:MAG TPA: hypothetical protein VMI54_16830 [Polyangiaceae bacterium]|nr:hypothetical protein [Polyangiaceae bacterium]
MLAPRAFAADCNTLGKPNPIYGAGGSAETATIAKVATYFASLTDHPITIFWTDPGACAGYQQYLNNSITNSAVKYWDASGNQLTCNATAQPADFAHMGNEHSFCVDSAALTVPSAWPAGYGTVLAPVQTLNIIADKDSSQKSISFEALYYLLGFGAGADGKSISPWTNPAYVVTRSPTSFATQFLVHSIFGNVTQPIFDDPGKNGQGTSDAGYNGRLGYRAADQQTVADQVAHFGDTDPEAPIGYVSGSAADANRSEVKTLAYQHQGQTCGFWPDSTDSTFDKINVRTGKYHFWTPGHFFAHVDADGTGHDIDHLVNADVETFIRAFVGSDDLDALNAVIDAGDVPLCSMQVTREGLDGAISSYASPDPTCGCYFESRVAGVAQCDTCEEGHNEDCTDPNAVCRRGYCEAY